MIIKIVLIIVIAYFFGIIGKIGLHYHITKLCNAEMKYSQNKPARIQSKKYPVPKETYHYRDRRVNKVYFTTKPLSADTYIKTLPFGRVFFWVLFPLVTIGLLIWVMIDISGPSVSGIISLFKSGSSAEVITIFLGLCSLFLFLWLCGYLCKPLYMYMSCTKTLYKSTHVIIEHYKKPDREVSYEEISDHIRTHKILVRNGRYEIPYEDGRIYVYCRGVIHNSKFYEFINSKCNINIPDTLTHHISVSKTGSFFMLAVICGGILLIPFTLIGLISAFVDASYNIQMMVNVFFTRYYGTMLPGLFFIILGLILQIKNVLQAKKIFKEYNDIIKVMWW